MLTPFFHFSRFRGINNVDDPIRIFDRDQREAAGASSLVAATDVDIDSRGKLQQRTGYTSRNAGAPHSLWADDNIGIALFVEGSDLKRLNVDYSETTIKTGLTPGLKMSYVTVNDDVVLSNNQVIGYVRNGIFNDFTAPTKHGKVAPIAGHIVRFYKGKLLVANGSTVYHSDTFALNQFDLRRNFLQFPGVLTMMEPVENGVYFSDGEKTYFVGGPDIANATMIVVAEYGAIAGTAQKIDGGLLGRDGTDGQAALWVATEGVCLGGNGGSFKNLTQTRYLPPTCRSYGTGLFRKDKSQYVVAMHN